MLERKAYKLSAREVLPYSTLIDRSAEDNRIAPVMRVHMGYDELLG